MNRIVVVGGVLVILAVVAFFILFAQFGPIITRVVEHMGSEMTKASVTLDKTEISATSGVGAMHGLKVGNPVNFESESALKFSRVKLVVDPATLTQPTVVIKEVLIAAPEVTYEFGGGNSNIDVLRKNVETYVRSAGGSGEDGGGERGGKKFIIEKLSIRDGKINISATLLKGNAMTVTLPNIELKDIGKSTGGATAGEVARQLFSALNAGVNRAVGGLDLAGVEGVMKEAVSDVQKQLEEGDGGSVKSLEDAGEKVGEAMKGLFGQ
jgi:hypothetical protein